MSPRVSVVTPYHNTEPFLAEAIESVLNQTYGDFEYILLDNCSTDGSAAIAERYARTDPRIRLERTSELLAADLNFSEGFRRIAPDATYAKMVLADDWIFPRCLEEMVAVAEAHPSAGIISSYRLKGTDVMGDGLPWPSTFLGGRSVARLHLQQGVFLFGTQTTPLFRASAVRGTFPFFNPAVQHSDTEACYRTLVEWDFGFVHQVLSFSRVRAESVSGRVQDFFPHQLDNFTTVRKFGRAFLSEDEYRNAERRAGTAYFSALGLAVLTRHDPAFWEYHRTWLATLGIRLRRVALWPYVVRAVADIVLNPLNTLSRIRERLRRR